eukprot:1176605-Prorocentrum_minimum.AAC.1
MASESPSESTGYVVGALDEFKSFPDHERGLRKMTGISCNSPHDDAPDDEDAGEPGKVGSYPRFLRPMGPS